MSRTRNSFESDLKASREAAGISIEDIQNETRISADVINRFEEGKLIGDPAFNAVYMKAFLTSYGAAIGLSASKILGAYEALQVGGYRGQLSPDGGVTKNDEESSDEPLEEKGTEVEEVESQDEIEWVPKEKPTQPGVTSKRNSPKPPKRRTSSSHSFDTAWGMIGGVTILIFAAVALVLWLIFRDPSPDEQIASNPQQEEQVVVDSTAEMETQPANPAPTLALPIRVSVVAGGDGLQGFRATQAPDVQRPYWVEFGAELVLESAEEVILAGEGGIGMDPDEVMIRFQGYEWRPQDGQILRINTSTGQALLDSLAATGLIPIGQ